MAAVETEMDAMRPYIVLPAMCSIRFKVERLVNGWCTVGQIDLPDVVRVMAAWLVLLTFFRELLKVLWDRVCDCVHQLEVTDHSLASSKIINIFQV